MNASELNCPICSSMEESVTNEILAHLSPVKAKKDKVILSPDIVSPGLYLIGKGRVKVFRLNSNGKELILHLLKDGDCFGEKSAMDGAPQGDFVTATDTMKPNTAIASRPATMRPLRVRPRLSATVPSTM